jgi:hypothetical protein
LNTLDAYQQYLSRYPQGKYVSEAMAEIGRIEKQAEDQKREREARERKAAEEDAFWEACRSEDTLEAYRRYVKRYPLGAYVVDAQVTIRRKELESAPVEGAGIDKAELEPKRMSNVRGILGGVVGMIIGLLLAFLFAYGLNFVSL